MNAMRRVLIVGGYASLIFLPVAAGIGWLVAGRAGAFGGLIGALIPLCFFGITVVVALVTARMAATALGAAVLGSWLLKVVGLLAVLVGLRNADFYDRTVFATALLVGTIATLTLEAWVVTKTRVPYTQ